jgi:hypothetical protein
MWSETLLCVRCCAVLLLDEEFNLVCGVTIFCELPIMDICIPDRKACHDQALKNKS